MQAGVKVSTESFKTTEKLSDCLLIHGSQPSPRLWRAGLKQVSAVALEELWPTRQDDKPSMQCLFISKLQTIFDYQAGPKKSLLSIF
jgi:hypothetical protein